MNNLDTTPKDLVGKVALVTGSSTGLGLAIAKELSNRGAKVALNYAHNQARAEAAFESFAKEGGVGALFKADVTEQASIQRLVAEIKAELGAVDILVPNATLDQPIKPIEDYRWEDYETMVRFFIKSPFLLTQAVIREMKANQWGRIVNLSSEVVELGVPNFSAYVAAKGGQKAWTHSMSNELAPFGITVNSVSPGWIPTERHADACESELDAYLEAIPAGRWGTPEDIAVAVANFCSPAASFVTGQTLCVNGGRSVS
ncbi:MULTISPECIES: SDR family NAD(P)-dependent oxidoreductase [unclassified Lentimonas]|uniref:SDR family NAD(P)-dependent oxidoreductase n=1 Tax=unclassified Lentimonas TaxID=2630993 RepID=UPI0013262341|nr:MULTISPECIES: SDR family oxidoreductase [unclassified Lentimonas]CAA6679937.1 3-oxoacyl-[acyl-carrier protein] reductase (EC [Lentimonas sp. CC4]CAA6683427.1 3-oxoacyl-[acyl-carrier protein] reductase (EC [Lentimonas sp. CC6]CAA7078099.1 3-oxoacyl-[acyl-carrier protein] reductase (EC [Lentimonas sp. CC4]CAA7171607.1 3-oxoacyl-[acyl-carrier protein] reductase (EC [Lentimonas sp. CC21]CAA7181393.1 3-oxoacyl-[acyl-carrier protein] reductase (EC [Lentimonas sp. CC8]